MTFSKYLVDTRVVRLTLIASIIVCAYWFLLFYVVKDVYRYPLVGALSEMLWLPMMALLALLPVLAILQLIFSRRKINALSFVSLLMMTATIIFMIRR